MTPKEEFEKRNNEFIKDMKKDKEFKDLSDKWFAKANSYEYSYHFSWMGRPIIQYPQDIIAMQEIIWKVKPDLIIETGIAHGGSIIFSASMIELLGNNGKVIGIDIDIREHNKKEIIKHPMYKNIHLIEGSSVNKNIFDKVKKLAKNYNNILVCLDSNHTHDHVLEELKLYSSIVTKNSYCVVFDSIIENLNCDFPNRPWSKGNNPMTAINTFLKNNDDFIIDNGVEDKLMISVAPSGYLKKIR